MLRWVPLSLAMSAWLLGCGGRTPLPVGGADADAAIDIAPAPLSCTPGILASDEDPSDIAIDRDYVYWTSWSSEIRRAPKWGGPVEHLITRYSAGNDLWPLALDDDSVFFGNRNGGIYRIPKAGGDPVLLASSMVADKIAVSGEYVYWGDNESKVLRVPKVGGPTTVLADTASQPSDVAVDASGVYVFDWLGPKAGIARVSETGTVSLLASMIYIQAPALDDTYVYYARYVDGGPHTVGRVPKAGGATETLAAGEDPTGLAVDRTNVYWTDLTAGVVWRTPLSKDPSASAKIATGQFGPRAIVADDECVYWTSDCCGDGGGKIVVARKN